MPSYKLMYWNSKGRAETVRMLFALAGKEYEDYRFKEGEWPGELKSNKEMFPLGQAPVLIIDGKTSMPHSQAINRHLAREFDLYGANNEEARQIDVINETVNDIFHKMIPIFYEKDEEKKKELVEKFKNDTKPFLDFLNDLLASPDKRFFVGNKETLADVIVFWLIEFLATHLPSVPLNSQNLDRFFKGITENSKLTDYLKNRPVTKN